MSHDSAQFSPSFLLAKEAEIEYNPHVFWRGLRGFFSLPPRSGFVQPWNANNPPLRSGLSTFLFLIGSLFSRVRACEKNINRYRNCRMAQRWFASVLLYAEKSLRALKGHEQIQTVLANIAADQATITAS
jgi:hypothetical protein